MLTQATSIGFVYWLLFSGKVAAILNTECLLSPCFVHARTDREKFITVNMLWKPKTLDPHLNPVPNCDPLAELCANINDISRVLLAGGPLPSRAKSLLYLGSIAKYKSTMAFKWPDGQTYYYRGANKTIPKYIDVQPYTNIPATYVWCNLSPAKFIEIQCRNYRGDRVPRCAEDHPTGNQCTPGLVCILKREDVGQVIIQGRPPVVPMNITIYGSDASEVFLVELVSENFVIPTPPPEKTTTTPEEITSSHTTQMGSTTVDENIGASTASSLATANTTYEQPTTSGITSRATNTLSSEKSSSPETFTTTSSFTTSINVFTSTSPTGTTFAMTPSTHVISSSTEATPTDKSWQSTATIFTTPASHSTSQNTASTSMGTEGQTTINYKQMTPFLSEEPYTEASNEPLFSPTTSTATSELRKPLEFAFALCICLMML